MNDIHLNINQTSYDIPMTGQDCNINLLTKMVKEAGRKTKADGVDVTAILLPGDFIAHGFSIYDTYDLNLVNYNWPLMMETFQTVMSVISDEFPGVPILPSIGNNDCYYHD